jgi:hypothetical protein
MTYNVPNAACSKPELTTELFLLFTPYSLLYKARRTFSTPEVHKFLELETSSASEGIKPTVAPIVQ